MDDVFKLGNSEGIVDDVQGDLLNLQKKLGIHNRYEGFLFLILSIIKKVIYSHLY